MLVDRGAEAQLLARDGAVRVWCAGCASGEEPYTLALVKKRPKLEIVATDADPHMIERARKAEYPASSVRELPAEERERGFEKIEGRFRLKPRPEVSFSCEDVRETMPDGPFDLVLCRNFVFTYYDESLQREIAARMAERVAPGGALLLGHHERLPEGAPGWTVWDDRQRIYRRT